MTHSRYLLLSLLFLMLLPMRAQNAKQIAHFKELADEQQAEYYFAEAAENLEHYIKLQTRRHVDTSQEQERLRYLHQCTRMLKATEMVTVVDSFVVNKAEFLAAYKVGSEAGTVDHYNHFFSREDQPQSVVYQTELRNKVYFALTHNEQTRLYMQDRLGDGWSQATPLEGLQEGNTNYPFLLSDGVTLYYAADGEDSLGGYDIYVTRYNTETNQYLRSEHLGMPFNSPYNDYMYVVDEYNNLGWFASDRFQAADSLCVYVFIPNEVRNTFNYENSNPETVRRAAMIHNIAQTWNDKDAVRRAQQRLAAVSYQQPEAEVKPDFTFVVDDANTYHFLDDFKSLPAKQLFAHWQQETREWQSLCALLDDRRTRYARGNATQRNNVREEILELEQTIEELETALCRMVLNIRSLEISGKQLQDE